MSPVYPRSTQNFQDLARAFDEYVSAGFRPPKPIASIEDLIVTTGSCFAENIGRSLAARGGNVVVNRLHEEANSPMANAALLDYMLFRDQSPHRSIFAPHVPGDLIDRILDPIKEARLLVLTVGVGISCFERSTGQMVLRPNSRRREELAWKFPDQAEQFRYLVAIVQVLKRINPSLKMIITVSPVPLYRSITTESPLVEDCISKSILRAAVHLLMQVGLPNIYYWPSFEAFRWMGSHIGPAYGMDDDLPRHPNREIVDIVTSSFMRCFIHGVGDEVTSALPRLNVVVDDDR